ncbi:hypothetical protein PENSPDRAFT_594751 [Peniophora sp. CONT]|nr:hypothetical protein PENSPDRAFT_594751 [Peniophora sp. CONT]
MTRPPLTDAIVDDHQEMYDYYDKFKEATDADTKERWSNQLRWEVARHAVGEEIVVYPLMEQYLGAKGKELADEDRTQHQEVKELLYKLESLSAGTDEHNNTLQRVMAHLKPHNDSEETNDLPPLEAALPEGASADAAARFKRTKKFVPTRAHPSAPNQPPLETMAGFLAAPIDKLLDAFAKFPTEEMKKSV